MATIEVEVWRRATQLGEIDTAAVLTVLQLAVLAAAVGWSAVLQRRHSRALALRPLARRRRPQAGRQRCWSCSAWLLSRHSPWWCRCSPCSSGRRVSSTGHSFDAWFNLGDVRSPPRASVGVDPVGALGNSLRAARSPPPSPSSSVVSRRSPSPPPSRGGRLLDTGLMLPLGTSAVTIGFGMLITFDTPPVDWRAEPWLVPVGHALVAVPFVVRSALGVLRAVDPKLTEAAATLGASPRRRLASGRGSPPLAPTRRWRRAWPRRSPSASSERPASSPAATSETVPIAIERLLSRDGRDAAGPWLRTVSDPGRGDDRSSSPSSSGEVNVLDVRDVTVSFATRGGAASRSSTGFA